jgi:uncharacterized protein (DUF1778 family)
MSKKTEKIDRLSESVDSLKAIRLSGSAAKRFIKWMETPQKPNDALLNAMQRYMKSTKYV